MMQNLSKSGVLGFGAVIALIGVLAIAVPIFSTQKTEEVARVGDLKLTAQTTTSHSIPPLVGPIALGLGVLVMAASLAIRR